MRRERGSVFIISLAVLAGLVAMLATIAANQRTVIMAETNRIETDNARIAAMDGVESAMNALANQSQPSGSTTNTGGSSTTQTQTGVTTLQDPWATYGGTNGATRFQLGPNTFRVQISDQSARINMNNAPQALLQQMPITQEQLDSLLDWTQPGQSPRPDGGKDAYYNALTNSYNAKLGPLSTVDELLQVKGFTAPALWQTQNNVISSVTQVSGSSNQQPVLADLITSYSYTDNKTAAGAARTNIATAARPGQARMARIALLTRLRITPAHAIVIAQTGFRTLGSVFTNPAVLRAGRLTPVEMRVILDNLTTSAAPRLSGRINLNTAPQSVLTVVPGFTPDLVQAIMQQQQQGLTSLGELATVPGVTAQVLGQAADYVTVQSDTFLIRVIGTSGSTHIAVEATVDMTNGTPKLISVQEPPYDNVIDRWTWDATTSSDTNLEGGV